jgi:hypothetical protein
VIQTNGSIRSTAGGQDILVLSDHQFVNHSTNPTVIDSGGRFHVYAKNLEGSDQGNLSGGLQVGVGYGDDVSSFSGNQFFFQNGLPVDTTLQDNAASSSIINTLPQEPRNIQQGSGTSNRQARVFNFVKPAGAGPVLIKSSSGVVSMRKTPVNSQKINPADQLRRVEDRLKLVDLSAP